MRACIHTYIHIYLSIYIYTVYVYIYIHRYIDTWIHRYIDTYIRTYIHTYIHIISIHGCGSKPVLSRGTPPPLLPTFVAGPLLQTLVAHLCVEYCSLQGACRGGVCRRTPPSVTNLCREMVAQACYKANVFDSLPYIYICYTCILYIDIHTNSCHYPKKA